MAFDAGKARVANQLIQDGLTAEQALIQAGVSPDDFDLYSVNEVGTPSTNRSYGQIQSAFASNPRPNEVIVPRGQDPGIDDEDEDLLQNAPVTSQTTTTTQTTQITGGGSTTRRVVPTQYENNATSNAIQAQANDLAAQKQARKDAIRAAGGSGADVLRDPEFRRLSNAQTAKEYEAEQARTAVPNTGGIVTTVTPGANQTITTQTVDGNFVTTRGSGFDPQAQTVDANQPSVVPARNFTAVDVTDPGEVPGVTVSDRLQTDPGEVPGETVFGPGFATDTGGVPSQELIVRSLSAQPQPDPFEVDGAGIGLTDEELFAQDNPITPETTEDTFAGPGYGFVYDEDGELIPADSAEAERIQSESAQPVDPFTFDEGSLEIPQDPQGFNESDLARTPEPPLNYSVAFEEDFGWVIVDNDTGSFIETDFASQAAAEDALRDITGQGIGSGFAGDPGNLTGTQAEQTEAAQDAAGKQIAQQQFTLQQRNNTTTQGDWRVRIRLLPGASYLYKDSVNYLMQPLRDSDGVVFPYVPTITTNYVARYDPYELVHANYRGFFYKNSHVGEIQLNGVFTAQDTAEASYLLAVIHFFRSCTKMFYGQDSEFRGSPPPLVELSGYGEFQFNNHPCLVSNFNYTLPNGVDYIRVSPNNQGVNLSNRRNPISTGSILDSAENRRKNNLLPPGAEPGRIDLGFSQGVNGTGQTSYVPTKMEIQLTMLPVQTREQVSKGFRLDEFARGNLLRGGFW